MSRLLLRLGGLAMLGALAYLVVGDVFFKGADYPLARTILIAGGLCVAAGLLAGAAGRTTAVLVGRTCPRCGRRVAHGRVYCEEHLKETINEYRDRHRESGS
jgi:hypothetical protein